MSNINEKELNELRQSLLTYKKKLQQEFHDELIREGSSSAIALAGKVHDKQEESLSEMLTEINLAMLYDQRGEKQEAEREFRKILEIGPGLGGGDLAAIHYSLGLLLAEDESRLAEAAESLAAAAELSPDNSRMHYNLGLAYQKLGRVTEAEKSLKQALRVTRSDPTECLIALAIFYSQQKHFKEAAQYADKLISREPSNPQWKQFRASLLEESETGDERR